jgi:outer membrane protein with beta-barrel domain
MRNLRTTILLLALAAAAPALAQTDVCIPEAFGVPALSGPPNWWDSGLPAPQHWPRPDDPRWRGAFVHLPMPGAAATEHVTFRALRTATDLYLLWHVTVDPVLDSNDQLWVAFSPNTPGEEDILINVVPFNAANTNVPAVAGDPLPPPFGVSVATRIQPAAFAAPPSLPHWIDPGNAANHTRVFRSTANNSWAILMEVPIDPDFDDGIGLANDFSMWFEVQVSHTVPNMVPYAFPAALSFDEVAVSTDDTGFQVTRRNVVPPNPACLLGVSLAVADVGTVAPAAVPCDPTDTLSSNIELKNAAGTAPGSNVLCARPLNQTGGTIGNGTLDATFRTANWGTQPDWNSVPDPLNTLWKTVNTTAVTGAQITNGNKGALSFTWNLVANGNVNDVNNVCTFDPQPTGLGCGAVPAANRRMRHQCMLVELSGVPGLSFSTSSVYRNMDFVGASTFKREAEVSVVGLAPPPTPEPQREVFLYVQTHNMPARVAGGGQGDEPGQEPPPPPPPPPDDAPGVAGAARPPLGEIPPLEQSEYGALRDANPTYEVHAFHDTGRTTTVRGTTYRILEPQTSFGYFVEHHGELEGWRHELIGAQQIAPDYYRIPVPEQGTARVTTVIEAIEPRRWSLSLHAGRNDPRGDIGKVCSGDLSWGVDLEYRFNSTWAAELFYGHEDFDCGGSDDEVEHLSLNGKAYFLSGPWRPFAGAGVGNYDFSPGPSETGFNLFAGLQANPLPRLGLEATARYHFVDASGVDADFLTYHLGLRIRF